MKTNKGFALIALLAIIAGVLIVGGGAYLWGKKGNVKVPPDVIQPVDDKKVSDCLPTTAPWIKVVSPNGGESYTASQQITVKWDSCNIKYPISIDLNKISSGYIPSFSNTIEKINLSSSIPNNGQKQVTLPVSSNYLSWSSGQKQYAIVVGIVESSQSIDIADISDDSFTINKNKDESNSNDQYGRYIEKGCKIASGCNGSIHCVDENYEIGGTICVALPEYACYKVNSARCEKQSSGKCEWAQTQELKSCIEKARK